MNSNVKIMHATMELMINRSDFQELIQTIPEKLLNLIYIDNVNIKFRNLFNHLDDFFSTSYFTNVLLRKAFRTLKESNIVLSNEKANPSFTKFLRALELMEQSQSNNTEIGKTFEIMSYTYFDNPEYDIGIAEYLCDAQLKDCIAFTHSDDTTVVIVKLLLSAKQFISFLNCMYLTPKKKAS